MLRRIARNLASAAWGIALAALGIGSIVFIGIFGLSLIDHFTSTGWDVVSQSEVRGPIRWWGLYGAAACALAAVVLYSLPEDAGEDYYCPNCHCPSCERERQERQAASVATAALAGSVAGGMIGGSSGGNN
jgi:hypothetical protein